MNHQYHLTMLHKKENDVVMKSSHHLRTSVRTIPTTTTTTTPRNQTVLIVLFVSLLSLYPNSTEIMVVVTAYTAAAVSVRSKIHSGRSSTLWNQPSQLQPQYDEPFSSTSTSTSSTSTSTTLYSSTPNNEMTMGMVTSGNQHGMNSCFLPLQQLEQDTYMPRIVSIVDGIYPSPELTMDTILNTPSVVDNLPPALGQWSYTFTPSPTTTTTSVSATIALEGSQIVTSCIDPIIVIAEHTSLNIALPSSITEPVDLLVLIDRSKTYFSERKFLLYSIQTNPNSNPANPNNNGIYIAAFHTRAELPSSDICTILGHVEQVTIPWLPAMQPTKTGFMEADEYY